MGGHQEEEERRKQQDEDEEEEEELRRGVEMLWEKSEAEGPMDPVAAAALWERYRAASRPISQRLCEQLRLVLEPLVATKLQGDYRSGKRINMRRVISYIASGFRRDKIWLRRTKPAKRAYQVLLAIDDSSSMRHFKAEDVALLSLATLASGMTTLEIGQLGVASFGSQLKILHDFADPFTEEAGARVMSSFTFQQQSTDGAAMLSSVISALDEARNSAATRSPVGSPDRVLQLVFVVSDGSFERGSKTELRRLVREMADKGQLLVLLLVDHSILDRQEVEYGAAGVRINRYLDTYPFPYYIVLQDVHVLPEVLSDALRQWFELVQRTAAAGQH
jgi:midasin